MQKTLDKIAAAGEDFDDISLLKELVSKIRPGFLRSSKVAKARVEKLTALLEENQVYRQKLCDYLERVFKNYDSLSLLTESGILSNEGFFSESFRKIAHIILPPAPVEHELRDAFNTIFHKKGDHKWIWKVPNKIIESFLATSFQDSNETLKKIESDVLLNATEVLAHRLTGIGLDPEIIKRHPELNTASSPFMKLNREVIDLIESFEQANEEEKKRLFEQCYKRVESCKEITKSIRKKQNETGASLSLTYILQRLHQHLMRLEVFLHILEQLDKDADWNYAAVFLKNLVRYENKRYSIREHFLKNIGILAYQITEHAGRTGEHYITQGKKDYWKMLYSAMGGGLIVGFLTWSKAIIYYMNLAPFGNAFMYSMNYSFGFIGIHLTHSTLATKQPAMTATKIASSLDIQGSAEDAIKNLSELIVKTFRSQFVAFVGNMFVAFPVALIIAAIYFWSTGGHIVEDEKAFKLINGMHPWESFSLLHGAIAGVCLFLAGVISGYYDNAVVFKNIPERLKNQPVLKFILPRFILNKFANYIAKNLGSLTGNFFLGIFLGSMGTIGYIFGLPLDIQHVTFASGNLGLSLVSVGSQLSLTTVLVTILGIIGIGFMNFIVSFSLAIFIAVQSRRVAFTKTGLLFRYLMIHLFSRPRDFLYPPEDEEKILEA